MAKLFSFLLGASILIFLGYTLVESIKIATGHSNQSWSDMVGFFIGALVILVILWYSLKQSKKLAEANEIINPEEEGPLSTKVEGKVEGNQTLRLIITASEDSCSKIRNDFEHPLVSGKFEDSGNWYSNGDTGPEWFTVTIETERQNCDKVEKALDVFLETRNIETGNRYWS